MSDNTCNDCDYPGDGKCSACHGTGSNPDWAQSFGDALVGESQDCQECNGSGKCSTCNGAGYI